MSGDNEKRPDEGAPPANEGRTVFVPSPTPSAQGGKSVAAEGDAEADTGESGPAASSRHPTVPQSENPEQDSEAESHRPTHAGTADDAWGSPPDAEPARPGKETLGAPPETDPGASADQAWGAPPVAGPEEPSQQAGGAMPPEPGRPGPGEGEGGHGGSWPPPAEDAGEQGTVWMPVPSGEPAQERWSTLGGNAGEPMAARDPGPAPTPTALSETMTSPPIQTHFVPNPSARAIEIGDVLNHIFEVKRFIAAGGMGKVYEGINVNSEERVAIKVMLPQLAADANVIAMFRREARTLTKLRHEALVNYRVLAQEPQLGVLYIVTEYVDGTNLSDQLGQIDPSPAELTALLRRLASGLRAAHALDAIHRDISPDNVLLEDGKLSGAKIIDFGIAKNLEPGSATIVGDGFAGKLSYVAPEQLGDFGRSVGTWSDVYSLALVILAVAQGRNVQMGGTLVDAVDKRRAGVDVSGAPEALRPVLTKMLKANPLDRLQTMDDVLAELDRPAGSSTAAKAPPDKPRIPPLWLAGGVGTLLVVIVGGWLLLFGEPASQSGEESASAVPSFADDPVEAARSALDSALPSVTCTWLAIVDIQASDGAPTVSFTGVAGNPAQAQGQLGRALEAARLQRASLNFQDVAPITPAGCAALDGFRTIRQPNPGGISVPQREFEMKMQGEGGEYPGQLAAKAVVELRTARAEDFTLVGIEPSGLLDQLIPNRAWLDEAIAYDQSIAEDGGPMQKTAEGYRLQTDSDHHGWTGLLLITGKPPFDEDIVAPPLGGRGPDWLSRFATIAAEREWKAEMVWYKLVDKAPD